jgi:membrane protein implicated in regulation of membrane protease activity
MVAEPLVDRTASLGDLVKDASNQVSTLVRAEIELAKLEITKSVKQGAIGGGFFAAAAATALFSLFFFWFMIGEILAIWLPRWAAFIIVFVLMVLIAAALGYLGVRRVKKIKKPEQTIASLNETAQVLKSAVSSTEPQVAVEQQR